MVSKLKRLLFEGLMVWIGSILAVFDGLLFNPLEARKILRHDLSSECRMVDRTIEELAGGKGWLFGFVPFWKRREVCGKKFDVVEAAFEGFAAAEKNYRLARFDPLLDFARRHGKEISNRRSEQVIIGGEDG
jgi:hypothetical protein